jgi:hypothetical protein
MITNESILKATIIEFEYDSNGNLIEKKNKLNNSRTVVINYNYIIDIETLEEYKLYNVNTDVEPNVKYIYSIEKVKNPDILLYTKALVAFNEFINKKVQPKKAKILDFKPKNNRDN